MSEGAGPDAALRGRTNPDAALRGRTKEDELSEQAYWLPVTFREQEVFARCDAQGNLVVQRGKSAFVYKLGAPKSYSTFADRLEVAPGAKPVPGKATPDKAGVKAKGKADSTVFGGTSEDVVDDAHVHLWTDGACTGNPGPAGAGLVLLDGAERRERSVWLGQGTNNIAELTAVLEGLRILPDLAGRKLVIHTDSQYVIGVLAKNWKAKANTELIAEIKAELRPLRGVVWRWVRGHQGVELNERCDALGRKAIDARRTTDSTD